MSSLKRISRRTFGTLLLATGAGTSFPAPAVRAQSKRLSVVVSAVYKKAFDSYAVPKMRELHGVEVASISLLSAEALARAIAQKDNPQISFMTLDQGPWLQGKDLDLWARLDPAIVTNLADIPAGYKDASGTGSAVASSLVGLVYDESAIKAAGAPLPTSILDLWKPEYRNQIAMPQFTNTYAFIGLAHINRLLGGADDDGFNRAFAKMKELKPNIRTFIGPLGQLIQLFQQKEIWMSYSPQSTALQAAAAGLPVKWAPAKDGVIASNHFITIPKNAPNMEDAQKLANLLLSPEYQRVMAEMIFGGPVNMKTQLDPAFAAKFPVTKELAAGASQVPWSEYNKHRVQLAERWQREVQS